MTSHPIQTSLSGIKRSPKGNLPNREVPGANEYYPLNEPAAGTALDKGDWPANEKLPLLFTPLKVRNTTFKNRVWVAPMCQYSSVDGHVTDWHLVHIGGFAVRGVGNITMEATSVTPEGRITPEDNGIWADSHVPGLKRIVDFVHAQGTKIGIQLGHAGRKASTRAPWAQADPTGSSYRPGDETASVEEGGWPENVVAPSAIAFKDGYPNPKALTESEIEDIISAFGEAARRAKEAGFDFVEVHGAHGYLIHQFLSVHGNKRDDKWGGSLDNRLRFAIEVSKKVRSAFGNDKVISFRVSATDFAEGPERNDKGEWLQWGIEQTKTLAKALKTEADIDLIDVSAGGVYAKQKIPIGPGYQVPLAEELKRDVGTGIIVSAVGLITDGQQAEDILQEGKADAIRLAREFLRNADFVFDSAMQLGTVLKAPVQYERAYSRMFKK